MKQADFLATFRPRLLDALAGYTRERFIKDLGAGLTVGIVALPLAMAFAIASGLKPEAGIWTAILAGAMVAALGGSAVQIAGPAGAFIVIVYGIVERYGLANLLISTSCAGVVSLPWIGSEHAAAGGDGPKAAQLSIHNFSCCLTTSDRSSLSARKARAV